MNVYEFAYNMQISTIDVLGLMLESPSTVTYNGKTYKRITSGISEFGTKFNMDYEIVEPEFPEQLATTDENTFKPGGTAMIPDYGQPIGQVESFVAHEYYETALSDLGHKTWSMSGGRTGTHNMATVLEFAVLVSLAPDLVTGVYFDEREGKSDHNKWRHAELKEIGEFIKKCEKGGKHSLERIFADDLGRSRYYWQKTIIRVHYKMSCCDRVISGDYSLSTYQ